MNDYELSGGIGAQEYNIGEYWEQFDDNSRWKNTDSVYQEPMDLMSDDELMTTMEEISKSVPESSLIEEEKSSMETKDLVKIMYGCKKTKHEILKSDEDKLIERKIDEAFQSMKKKTESYNPNIKK